jgi:hypothetical protein
MDNGLNRGLNRGLNHGSNHFFTVDARYPRASGFLLFQAVTTAASPASVAGNAAISANVSGLVGNRSV